MRLFQKKMILSSGKKYAIGRVVICTLSNQFHFHCLVFLQVSDHCSGMCSAVILRYWLSSISVWIAVEYEASLGSDYPCFSFKT